MHKGKVKDNGMSHARGKADVPGEMHWRRWCMVGRMAYDGKGGVRWEESCMVEMQSATRRALQDGKDEMRRMAD